MYNKDDQLYKNIMKNIHIAVILETTRKSKYPKELDHYIQIHKGVHTNVRVEGGEMIWKRK